MLNILTVDVEDWYQTNDFNIPRDKWDGYQDRVDFNTRRLLDIFDEYGVKGSFFILGCVAQKHPPLVREIVRRGHELGSHGGWHQMLTSLTYKQVEEDISWTKALLEEISGVEVFGFRAPSWSISRENLWVLEILEAQGFRLDSSLQPFRTPLSGMTGAPVHPFHPVVNGRRLSLLEFPSTVAKVGGRNVPFAGGLYLRFLPLPLIATLLRRVNQNRSGMIYIHPWEIDIEQPRIRPSWLIHTVHYHGLESTEAKLKKLLSDFSFGRFVDVLPKTSHPQVVLST